MTYGCGNIQKICSNFLVPHWGSLLKQQQPYHAEVFRFFCRGRKTAFRWTLFCAACMLIAHLTWWLLIYPVNQETISWTKHSIPGDWFLYRAQWEFTHAMRAIFEIVAFILLIVSVLVETPKDGTSKKSQFINVSAGNDNSQIKFGALLIGIFNSLLEYLSSSTFQIFFRRARVD